MISAVSAAMPPSRRNPSRPARCVTMWKFTARRPLTMVKRATLARIQPTMSTTSATASRGRNSPAWRRDARSGSSIMSRSIIHCLLSLSLFRFQHREQPGERHLHPVGAIAELVAQLVERLLQLEEPQEARDIVEGAEKSAPLRGGGVGGEERLARGALPSVQLARLRHAPFGVAERAQHPGDVTQRRRLLPALGERARWLALEIDDEPVVVGEEHLA